MSKLLNRFEDYRRCVKCHVNLSEDNERTFHKFPHPGGTEETILKARIWACYCYPDQEELWSSYEALKQIYRNHKVLCDKHFDEGSFTNSSRRKLRKYTIPVGTQDLLQKFRNDNSIKAPERQVKKKKTNAQEASLTQPSTSGFIIAQEVIETPPATSSLSNEQEVIQTQASTSSFYNAQEVIQTQASTSLPVKLQTQITEHSYSRKIHPAKGILKELDINTVAMTPVKRKLYKKCRRNLSEISRLRSKFKAIRKKYFHTAVLRGLAADPHVTSLATKITGPCALFLQSQIKNTPRKITGRRWNVEEKVLALSLYKKSAAAYKLLRRMFCLPSEGTLKSLLNKTPFVCGINYQIINSVRDIAEKRTSEENMCSLLFDEMSIRKNLQYDLKLDQIAGFQDHGTQGRSREPATHALVFMAVGMRKSWKQIMAYYFSGECVTADRLAVLIKEIITACHTAGLIVMCTICDGDGTNRRAINLLGSTEAQPYFILEGHEIITLFDPPHLLKCFRNNFLKYNIQCDSDITIDGKKTRGTAKWSHLEDFFEKDNQNPNFVFAPALTRQHLQPNGKQKMKVNLAAQIFSHSVAAGLLAKISQNELPQEATATANFIAKMDNLFDCFNGTTPDRKRGKMYLTNMTKTSPHFNFFKDVKFFLSSLKFIDARADPPSKQAWITTINGIQRVFLNLESKGIHSLSPRRLNQDPLENCFGCIRSYCGSNTNPNATQFVAALKTAIVTNLMHTGTKRNCQNDNNDMLADLKAYLTKNIQLNEFADRVNRVEQLPESASIDLTDLPSLLESSGEMQACAYVAGYIFKKMNVHCSKCKSVMLASDQGECHVFTQCKEYYDTNKLNYVSNVYINCVESCATLANNFYQSKPEVDSIGSRVKKCIYSSVNFDFLKNACNDHAEFNKKKIVDYVFIITIHRYCEKRNRLYSEEAHKKALKNKISILKHV